MTSSLPAAAAVASGGVSKQTTPASSRWLRLRLHSSGSGRRVLPSALLAQRRRHQSATSLGRRDYSVDKLTDAVYHEFLRHDPQLDVRQSPLVVQSSQVSAADGGRTARRPWSGVWPPLSAHVEEKETEWLTGSGARRIPQSCLNATTARGDVKTIVCRDST